ncbi:MAG: DGQHR domain-containing protein [Deltaproteobacteria bacterium]|nr:DGQHR domain-containing protein [Deltaproteobacteria bacterium]
MSLASELRLPALEIRQGQNRLLYSFAVDGKQVHDFAAVARIRRGEGSRIGGYQRPEVLSHIAEIRNYVESEDPMIPNAVVIAFDDRVRFEAKEEHARGFSRHGVLVIPCDPKQDEAEKPGWIVDGQQRLAAIRDARVDGFPICVTGFIAGDDREQREQFILVNSTKPLPKGLIYELLPTTEAKLPSLLQKRRFPAFLLERLNQDADSPLKGLIRTPTTAEGLIKDNSVLKMLENSLSDGVLYRFRDPKSGKGDVDAMLDVLKAFWGATSKVFEDSWNMPPRRSRLMHGAGIVSLGFLMDAIAERHRGTGVPDADVFEGDLEPLKDVCRWTQGYWEFGPGAQRKWNEIQNTSKDIQLLANYLLVQYKIRVWQPGQRPNTRNQSGRQS